MQRQVGDKELFVQVKNLSRRLECTPCRANRERAYAYRNTHRLARPTGAPGNEGLAEASAGAWRARFREDDLVPVQGTPSEGPAPIAPVLARLQGQAIAHCPVRGHWIVRLLEESQAGFVRGLLARRGTPRETERRAAEGLSVQTGEFLEGIKDGLVNYFKWHGPLAA